MRRWPVGIASLAGLLLLAAGIAWTLGFRGGVRSAQYDSIAVLPFANLSGVAAELRASVVDEDFRGDHRDVVGGYSYITSVMASRQRGHVLRNDVAVRLGGIAVDLGQESQFRTIRATHDATHFDASVSGAYGYRTRVHAGYIR